MSFFQTDDCLIDVTAWAGLTVHLFHYFYFLLFHTQTYKFCSTVDRPVYS